MARASLMLMARVAKPASKAWRARASLQARASVRPSTRSSELLPRKRSTPERATHDVVEALGLVALDDHHVNIVVARQQLARGHLVLLARVGVLRPARGADEAHVFGAGLVMAPSILSGHIDIEAVMPMMLERTHAQAAAGELGDNLLDERGLARVLVADKRNRGGRPGVGAAGATATGALAGASPAAPTASVAAA